MKTKAPLHSIAALFALALLATFGATHEAKAQTLVFSDNFATGQGTTYTTSGTIGTSDWSVTRSGADWGARINGGILDLSNDASATANANGWVYAQRTLSSTGNFNTVLSSSAGTVSWTFNMRQIRSDPSGFGSSSYGVAYIIGTTSTTAATAGNGYAIVLGNAGGTDPIRLVRFTNGLRGTQTTLITASAPLADVGADYLSLSLNYDPFSNGWSLFGRNDGSTAFTDPNSGSLSSLGSAIDSTYTGVSLTSTGAYWQGSTGGNQTAFFDNISLTAADAPAVFTTWTGTGSPGTWQNGAAGQFGGNYANDLDNTVTFAGTGGTVNTASTPQAGNLVFGVSGFLITGALQLGVGDVGVTSASHTAEISANISGDAGSGLTKSGNGTLVLSGNNTFTGGTSVSSGTLEVRSANALGTTAGGTTVSSGATLAVAGGLTTAAEALSLNGTGVSGSGALRNASGNNTYAGAITLATDARINSTMDTLTVTGGITGTGRTVTVGGNGNVAVSTTGLNTSTGGQLVKDGAGELTISAAGNFTGGTTVDGGTLRAGVASALGTGSVSVEAGQLFGAAGVTTANAITVDGGEKLLAYWNFNGINAAAASFAANVGTGTIDMAGWGGEVSVFGGSEINALAGVVAGDSLSLAGSGGNNTFIQIEGFSMAGFSDLAVSFATRGTSTGYDSSQWSYSFDGINFVNFGVNTATRSTTFALAEPGSTSGLDGEAAAFLRYTLDGSTGGNNRIDNLQLNAVSVPSLGSDITSGTTTFSGGVTLNSDAEFTSAGSANVIFSGAVSGANEITKTGAGTVTLSGTSANTFSGMTTVSAGTLQLSKEAGTDALAGAVTVNNEAVLLLSASNQVNDNSAVSLSGGTITRGSGVSEVFGDLNLTAGSFLDFGSGGTGTLSFGTYTPSALTALNIVNFTQGNTLTFGSNLTSSIETSAFAFSGNGGLGSYSWDNDSSTFTITAIPEPSTYLAAAGLLGLMLWPSRKRLLKNAKKILGITPPMRDRLAARRS